ncbi:MAG: homoserine kinase, partial [Weissella confusa]
KLTLAARTEGQPANVTAAWLGGVTASYLNDGNVFASGVVAPEYQAVIYLPEYQRDDKVDKPTEIALADATATAAAGNMLLAAWQSQQLVLAGQLLETDNIQRAVINDVPELGKIRQASHALDVYGSVVAGDGPAVVTLVAPNQTQDLLDVLAYLELPGEFKVVDIAGTGLTVF